MLMCCVTEWCIHTELAVVKCVNVLDRSLAGLSPSFKKLAPNFRHQVSTLVITEVMFVLSNIIQTTYCI